MGADRITVLNGLFTEAQQILKAGNCPLTGPSRVFKRENKRPRPENGEERLWLIDGIGSAWQGLLGQWRGDVLNDVIRQADQATPPHWAKKYLALGYDAATVWETCWKERPGIRRVCLVQPIHQMDLKEENLAQLQGAPALKNFLPFMADSIKTISTPKSREKQENAYLEQEIPLRIYKSETQDKDIGFRIWWVIGIDKDHEAILAKLRTKRDEWLKDTGSIERMVHDPFFFFLIDSPCPHSGRSQFEAVTHLYGKMTETVPHERVKDLQFIEGKMGIDVAGIGLEGIVAERFLGSSNQSVGLDIGGEDSFWGGGAWLAWVICLFQRTVTESYAEDAGNLAKKFTKDAKDKDLREDGRNFLKKVISLETSWMYPELAKSTELDRFYALLQKVYDIEKIWDDLRNQTEMVINIIESDYQQQELGYQHEEVARQEQLEINMRKLNVRQTLVGMAAGGMIFLTGFFGMNFKEFGEELSFYSFYFRDMILLVCAVISFFGVLYWRQADQMTKKEIDAQVSSKVFRRTDIPFFLLAAVVASDLLTHGKLFKSILNFLRQNLAQLYMLLRTYLNL